MLFLVISEISFASACLGGLFYGISSQTFSVNRTIGGRLVGAWNWIGSFLCGGVIGFLIVSLAWLARGDAKAVLEYQYAGTNITILGGPQQYESYLKNAAWQPIPSAWWGIENLTANATVDAVRELEELDSETVSPAFWVLLIVLHAVFSIVLSYSRGFSKSLELMYSLISIVMMSMITVLGGGLMPLLGQRLFWDNVVGSFIKALLLVSGGMFCSAFLVYVQSSHDEVRERTAKLMVRMGQSMSWLSSSLHLCTSNAPLGDGKEDTDGDKEGDFGIEKKSKEMKSLLDEWKSRQKVGNVAELLKESLGIKSYIGTCFFEPPWPGFCSQWGADYRKYDALLFQIQIFLGTLNCIDSIVRQVLSAMVYNHSPEDMARIQPLLSAIINVLTTVSGVLIELAETLKTMDFGKKCSGNDLVWRPKSLEFWDSKMSDLRQAIYSHLDTMKESSRRGVMSALDKVDVDMQPTFHLDGSSAVLIASCESLIDNCTQIEVSAANALDITDSSDVMHLSKIKIAPSADGCDDEVSKKKYSMIERARKIWDRIWMRYATYLQPCWETVWLASGLFSWSIQLRSLRKIATKICSSDFFLYSCNFRKAITKKNVYTYMKFYLAMNLALIIIILVIWLGFSNSDSAVQNAIDAANFCSKWQPQYFILATAICLQETVDATIIKIILRCILIGVGGALGYVAMLNGSVAQNPYYIFFLTVLVNGFFGLFSYISLDFRYSLFLTVYTFNGIVLCQYSGVCCQSGELLYYGGKAVPTILGAVYAFVISTLIYPEYASDVLFGLEGSFLRVCSKFLLESFEKGHETILQSTVDPPETSDSIKARQYPHIGFSKNKESYEHIQGLISSMTKQRLAILQAMLTERETRSLDNRFLLVRRVTLIPLPKSTFIIFEKLNAFGAYINASLRLLRSILLRQEVSQPAQVFLDAMMPASIDLFDVVPDVVSEIGNLITNRGGNTLKRQETLQISLELLRQSRSNLRVKFESIRDGVLETHDWKYSDNRCLIWYQMLLASLRELEALAFIVTIDEKALEKDDYSSWLVSWWTRADWL